MERAPFELLSEAQLVPVLAAVPSEPVECSRVLVTSAEEWLVHLGGVRDPSTPPPANWAEQDIPLITSFCNTSCRDCPSIVIDSIERETTRLPVRATVKHGRDLDCSALIYDAAGALIPKLGLPVEFEVGFTTGC